MNLVCDFGNTSYKLGLFQNGELVKSISVPNLNTTALEKWLADTTIKHSMICSVVDHPPELEEFLSGRSELKIFSPNTPLPIAVDYNTPETLGADRIANTVAANKRYPKQNCLVVDAGTCVKFDLVSEGTYRGGSISPGLNMRFRALQAFTDKLPLVALTDKPSLVGKDTKTSIQSGVINGIMHEIRAMIETYRQEYPDLKVIITGGDALIVAQAVGSGKNNIFALALLTLEGLNEILDYNAE